MADKAYTFICGDDDFLINREGRAVYEEMARGLDDDLSREVINGMVQNLEEAEKMLEQLRGALLTMSMFGDRKAVWLKNLTLLADTPTGRSEGAEKLLEQMQHLLQSHDSSQVSVLITAHPVDRRRREFKWLSANGEYKDLKGSASEASLADLACAEADKLGVKLDADAARILISRVGENSRLLLLEVAKLAAFLGGEGVINEALVIDMVPEFGESDFFEVTEAFYTLNLQTALAANRRYFFTRSSARPLLINLQNRARVLIQLRVLFDAGQLGRGVVGKAAIERAASTYARHFEGLNAKSAFNVFSQNAWFLGNRLAPVAQKITLKRLIDFQLEFKRAFVDLLDRRDDEGVVRDLLIRCLS